MIFDSRWAGAAVATVDEPAKARLLLGVSCVALAAVAAPAQAQAQAATPAPAAAPADDSHTIVVTGFRGSLKKASQIKKASDTAVDSITADDINSLPDRSVTEAIQRIPGIAINRFAAGVDPDHFSAEGSGVVVRGLTYTRSEFNGRDAFSANNGRPLSFSDVPSELLGGVDVYKSLSAEHVEGGIAGTVDLKTRKPFDSTKSFIGATLTGNYSDFAAKLAPAGAFIASKRWSTEMGDFGLLASYSVNRLFDRSDRLALSHFRPYCLSTAGGSTVTNIVPVGTPCPTGQSAALVPSGAVEGSQDFDRKRWGITGAMQWRSNDGRMEASVQLIHSLTKEAWTEHTVEITTDNVDNNGGIFAPPGTKFNVDSSGLFSSGTITGNTGWRADQWQFGPSGQIQTRVPTTGLQSNNIAREHDERYLTNDISANFLWKMTDRLTMRADFQHVYSATNIFDNTLWGSTYQDLSIKVNGFNLPTVQFLPPSNIPGNSGNAINDNPIYATTNAAIASNPAYSFYRAAMDHIEQSDGYENAAKLDLKYDFPDDSFLKDAKVGYRFADRKQTARYSTYNWGVLSEQWGNGGPIWFNTPVAGLTPQVAPYTFSNFFGGAVADPLGGLGRLYYTGNPVTGYGAFVNYANAIAKQWQGTTTCPGTTKVVNSGWNALPNRCGVVAGTPFLPGEINPANERNNAAYIQLDFAHDMGGGKRLTGNIGVRYTSTQRRADGGAFFNSGNAYPTDCAAQLTNYATTGARPAPFCALPANVQAAVLGYNAGVYTASSVNLTTNYWLPSLNLKYELGNGVQLRGSYFKGVAPPDFGLTRNYLQVNALSANYKLGSTTATANDVYLSATTVAGNPLLKPVTSDNFDLSAEYYWGGGNQITAAVFYKSLKNVIVGNSFSTSIPVGTTTATIQGYQPQNSSDTGKVKGFELSYQQNYTFLPGALKGLGLIATYTFVDSSGVPQSTLSSTDPDVAAGRVSNIPGANFPLQGLSKHTVNVTPYYEWGPFSLRMSYNWRSKYLLTLRDVITPFDPIFQLGYGQLDGEFGLKINDHLKLDLQVANLTDAVTRTAAAVYDQNKNIVLVPRAWYKADRRYSLSIKANF